MGGQQNMLGPNHRANAQQFLVIPDGSHERHGLDTRDWTAMHEVGLKIQKHFERHT